MKNFLVTIVFFLLIQISNSQPWTPPSGYGPSAGHTTIQGPLFFDSDSIMFKEAINGYVLTGLPGGNTNWESVNSLFSVGSFRVGFGDSSGHLISDTTFRFIPEPPDRSRLTQLYVGNVQPGFPVSSCNPLNSTIGGGIEGRIYTGQNFCNSVRLFSTIVDSCGSIDLQYPYGDNNSFVFPANFATLGYVLTGTGGATAWMPSGAPSDVIDYSSSSTIVGWTTFSAKVIRYQIFPHKISVQFYINGTSNSTTTSFTLPVQSKNNGLSSIFSCAITDNGNALTTPAFCKMLPTSNTVTIYKDWAGALSTNVNMKTIQGEFFYEY